MGQDDAAARCAAIARVIAGNGDPGGDSGTVAREVETVPAAWPTGPRWAAR